MAQIAETREEFRDDQIVVATPHVATVRQVLTAHNVNAEHLEDSAELGLTLLALHPGEVARAARENERPGAPVAALSRLLDLLYQEIGERYKGWLPTIGKNRVVQSVIAAHNIDGGGAGLPRRAPSHLAPRDGDPGRDARVGVADTALYAHPWLAGAYEAAPASVWGRSGPGDLVGGHATFVAGLVMQRAPGATLEIRSVLGPGAKADSWDVAKKLVRFARSGLDVLNLSFSCFTDDNKPPLVLATALDRIDPRVVVVAAAGNHGMTADAGRPAWPAAFEEVVAVTAVDGKGVLPKWSPLPELPWVDLAATGTDVASTFLKGSFTDGSAGEAADEQFDGFATWSGTSFAAAQVSGAIAALIAPGEVGARAALAELLRSAQRLPGAAQERYGSIPWIK